MLPVYRAISFQRIIDKGGRTRPWLIVVDAGGFLKPYVVKLFEASEIDARDSVTKEVIGNVLAKEFDLQTPNAALIDLDEDFVSTIRNQQILEILDSKDYRVKFGTELLEGTVPFDVKIFAAKEARQMVDMDTVLAFDCLIRNPDRNRKNPNLLVTSDSGFLIDHELALDITANTINEILGWYIPDRYFRYHLFYNYLKHSYKKQKEEFFNVFEEYLRNLNTNTLNSYLNQLSSLGFSNKNHNLIKDYVSKMKYNSSIFVNILRGQI